MDEQSAKNLLNETFNNAFDMDRFSKFITELFNKIVIFPKNYHPWEEYADYIDSCQMLGSYKDRHNKIIDILVIKLKKSSSIDRARTMQRNFVAKYLGNKDKDSALVAFYGDDPQDWRFSFVKMEYQLKEVKPGKVKIDKELTPAKRYSFLVGKNEPNHTCMGSFLELVKEEDVNPSIEEIEKAFSVDNVTKEFFLLYKELYLELKDSMEEVIKNNINVRKEFDEKNISTIDFAKKLLGQIVFIYFLQKKGWLGVEKDESGKFKEWGTGPKKFLRKLFDKEIVGYNNFFNDILEPLFYEALATERDGDYYSRFRCKIPFLNGGLFEPISDYNWAGTEILLDDPIFKRILDTFDRFNFTVKEDEPLEKEVAIDPEMLGKVFENLLEVKDRKSAGKFYTPREIVHYMCQQSLINYLETNTNILRNEIEKFVLMGDFAVEYIIRKQQLIRKYGESDVDERLVLPKTIEENYLKIDKLLKDIKIVDPAVGSGAFPVGMMNEIVKSRSILTIFFKEDEQKKRTNYDLKRETIENSLYGVDIDSSAVDITKLRFWLSLIVDELDMKNIKPLPNLDHRIMCGNSLLEEFEGIKLFDESMLEEIPKDYSVQLERIKKEEDRLYKELHEIITGKKKDDERKKQIQRELNKFKRERNEIVHGPKKDIREGTLNEALQKRKKESQTKLKELRQLQKFYFKEQNKKQKIKYAEDIEKIEWELIEETLKEQGNEKAMQKLEQYKKNKSKPFFLWKLYFSEVFQRENPGFDVVIANPPYVNVKDISADLKNIYKKKYDVIGRQDLYILFIEEGLNLVRLSGTLSYISSNKFLITKNGKNIRENILENTNIQTIIDVSSCNIFKEASVYPSVYILKKKQIRNSDDNNFLTIKLTDQELYEGGLYKKELYHLISQNRILNNNEYMFDISLNDDYLELINKIIKGSVNLIKISDIRNGIIVGDQKRYVIKSETYNSLSNREQQRYKKVVGGRDIYYYGLKWNNEYVLYEKEFLVAPRDETFFKNKKIIIRDIALRLTATYDEKGYYCLQTMNVLQILDKRVDYKFLLGVLNSKLMDFFYKVKYGNVHVGGNYNRYRERYLQDFPIKLGNNDGSKHIIQSVDQILFITKDDDYLSNPDKQAKVKKLEKEIDQLVYKLYELTPEDIGIVENFWKGK